MMQDTLRQLRIDRDRFVAFSFAGADLLLELDSNGIIQYAAGAVHRITGHSASALLGQCFFDMVEPDDRRLLTALLARLSRSGLRSDPVVLRLRGAKEGSAVRPAVVSACRLPDETNAYYLAVSEARPGTAAHLLGAHRDETSGLLTAKDFQRHAIECLRVARDVGADLGLTLIELGNFDSFAEGAGADAAETLLGKVGGTLRAASVGGDAAGRLEESRLAVLHAATIDSSSLHDDIDQLVRKADPAGTINVASASLEFPAQGLTLDDVANAIFYAVTKFAASGAEAFALASAEDALKALVADTVARTEAFKSTVTQDKFTVVYQPVFQLTQRKLHHYEALSRFENDKSPFEVIHFAESVAVIGEFDLAVCRRVLETLEELRAAGTPALIAVNLSRRSIGSDLFVAALRGLLAHHGDLREDLMFEITESTQIDDLVRVGNIIHALRMAGHRICLDDFGADAASFPYLRALDVDFVKIDGAYVKKAQAEKRDRAIVKSMAALCNDLDVGTIAEMIETEEQAELVASLGMGYGQGWLFGKPGQIDAVTSVGSSLAARSPAPARRRVAIAQKA